MCERGESAEGNLFGGINTGWIEDFPAQFECRKTDISARG